MVLNGVERTYMHGVPAPSSIVDTVTELYTSVRSRDRFRNCLETFIEAVGPAEAALAIHKQPLSSTVFVAVLVPNHPDMQMRDQWLFVPRDEDVAGFVHATHFTDLPVGEMGHLDFGFRVKSARSISLPASAAGLVQEGRLWLLSGSRLGLLRGALHARRTRLLARISAPILAPDTTANARVSAAISQGSTARRRTMLERAVQKVDVFEDTSPESSLEIVRDVLEVQQIRYYEVHLQKTPVEAVCRWCVAPDDEVAPALPLDVLEKVMLGQDAHREGEDIYEPVAVDGKTFGFLRVSGTGSGVAKDALVLLREFSTRLAEALQQRRVLRCVETTMSLVSQLTGSDASDRSVYDQLASEIAQILAEAACSLWIYEGTREAFTCVGRAGADLGLTRIAAGDAEALVPAVYSSDGPVLVGLGEDKPPVRARKALLTDGFTQGLGVAAKSDDIGVVLLLWLKAPRVGNHFTKADITLLNLVAFILLQVAGLHKLASYQGQIRDETVTFLGHELRSPLVGLKGGLEFMNRRREWKSIRSHLVDDLAHMCDIALYLVGNLILYGEVEGTVWLAPSDARERTPCRLFEGVVFPIVQALEFAARSKGLEFRTSFSRGAFPEYVALSERERKYVEICLFNLLWNAVKYGQSKRGRIILVRGIAERANIRVSVANYGIGVPEAEEESIFGKFTRGSNAAEGSPAGGSGLGLYMVRKLARLLGGDVILALRDDPTTFELLLPDKMAATPGRGRS